MNGIQKMRRDTYVKRKDRVKRQMEKHRPLVTCFGPIHPEDVKTYERIERNLDYVNAKLEYYAKREVEVEVEAEAS